MSTFHENKTLTFEGNLTKIARKARVGDTYIGSTVSYIRVDARINKGWAWIIKGE